MIHQYQLNGYNIVLDVYSGSVHWVDDVAYDMIALFETTPAALIIDLMLAKYGHRPDINETELRNVLDEINQLKEEGKLFTSDTYADKAIDLKVKNNAIKALCLHVSHNCNLTCDYCFASQGKFQGERALMSFAVGKQALDFLIANSGTRTNLEVDFFGGEPLMNWPVIKQLVAYARSRETECRKHFRFTLTTNGMLIDDEVIDYANREMDNVVLSLDGRPEIHDRLRRASNGKGSYEVIVPKFQQFVQRRGNRKYYIRGTFTHYNTDFTNDIYHMLDLGFSELSLEPVVCPPSDPFALKEEDLPALYEQYELLAKEQIKRAQTGRPFTFFHYMIDLTSGPCIYKRITGCGSGSEYLAVTPWGELFPCHQFVGEPAFSMGDVWQGVTNLSLQDAFRKCNVYTRNECRDCWAKLHCSGGCAANAYHTTGAIDGVYEYGCRLFRKRIECAIMIKVAEIDNS